MQLMNIPLANRTEEDFSTLANQASRNRTQGQMGAQEEISKKSPHHKGEEVSPQHLPQLRPAEVFTDTFPEGLTVGTSFLNISQVKAFMKTAARNQAHPPYANLFKKTNGTKGDKLSRLKFRCQQCPAYIDFASGPGQLKVVEINIKHNHQLLCKALGSISTLPSNQQILHVEKRRSPAHKKTSSRKKANKRSSLPKSVPKNSTVRPQEQLREVIDGQSYPRYELGTLKGWIDEHRHNYKVQTTQTGELEMLLVCSESMVNDYYRFGELVSLDIQRQVDVSEHQQRYDVITLSCYDTNMRMVLVGLAVVRDLSKRSYSILLEEFCSITEKPFKDITSDWSSELTDSIEELKRKQMMTGKQVYSIHYIQEDLHKQLEKVCEPTVAYQILNEVTKAMKTSDLATYQQSIELLRISPLSKDLIGKLLVCKQKVFYCQLPENVFVGLRNCNSLQRREIRPVRKEKTYTPNHFVRKYLEEDCKYDMAIDAIFEPFRQISEAYIIDHRFSLIQAQYEEKVVECFLERYNDALRTCQIVRTMTRERNSTEYVIFQNGKEYIVQDFICSCKEMERSGVGCCHAISVVAHTPSRQYTQLISTRWFKPLIKREPIS